MAIEEMQKTTPIKMFFCRNEKGFVDLLFLPFPVVLFRNVSDGGGGGGVGACCSLGLILRVDLILNGELIESLLSGKSCSYHVSWKPEVGPAQAAHPMTGCSSRCL